jgi:P27 family predicted phage terminase small subunit
VPAHKIRQEAAVATGVNRLQPERQREIVPVTDERPQPPLLVQADELCLTLWNETCDVLQSMRFLVSEDKQILESYVLNYRELLVCAEELRSGGQTSPTANGTKPSGASQNWGKLMSLHVKLLNELGLTPAARARLAPPKNRSSKEESSVGNLLKKLGNG